jgi:hypothetical protein
MHCEADSSFLGLLLSTNVFAIFKENLIALKAIQRFSLLKLPENISTQDAQ